MQLSVAWASAHFSCDMSCRETIRLPAKQNEYVQFTFPAIYFQVLCDLCGEIITRERWAEAHATEAAADRRGSR